MNTPHTESIKVTGAAVFEFENIHTGKKDIIKVNNMIVTAAKNTIANRLIGSSVGYITYCALGTGSTAPVAGNTTLGTELFRKLVSVKSVSTNIATFQTFFTSSEGNGTLGEAGLFGDDATASSGTGTLFSRLLISRVKSSSDTLTLTWTITIG